MTGKAEIGGEGKMVLMDILQAFGAITLPIIVTVILSNRQTHQILSRIESVLCEVKKVQEDTTCMLRKMHKVQEDMRRVQEDTTCMLRKMQKVQEDISCTLKKVRRIQEDTTCLLRKVDLGLRANAVMHGWRRIDGLTPEEARKLPEPKVYDEELKICYYKPQSSTTSLFEEPRNKI
ncbi:MAG: hypothetical protein QXT22_02625 [Candidatus Hadarchaeales archaeon]